MIPTIMRTAVRSVLARRGFAAIARSKLLGCIKGSFEAVIVQFSFSSKPSKDGRSSRRLKIMDQNYRNLLLHLQKPSGSSLHKGIPPTLAHYLSILPVPLPTTLTATAIASSVWTPSNVSSLLLAFRNAVHRKVDLLAPSTITAGAGTGTTESSLFSLSPGPVWGFRKWTRALCSGMRNGHAFVRIAALGGVLMGLDDMKDRLSAGDARWKVEDEVIVALAEYFEAEKDPWANEVLGQENKDKDAMLHIASSVLPLVSESKFRILQLPSIITQCLMYIKTLFQDPQFLPSESQNESDSYKEAIQNHLPLISRLASRCIDVLSDNPSGPKLRLLHEKLEEVVETFQYIATRVEDNWIRSEGILDADPATSSSDSAWTRLKALLFSVVMILQSVTDSVLYNLFSADSNPSLASRVIETFSHLSFISTKFGGVVARGEGSFREYQRAVYTALDIVAASPPCGEEMIIRLGLQRQELVGKELADGHPVLLAVTAFYLAVVEQLVDQISTRVLLDEVFPVCTAYLDKAQHREAFESSHSVVLALFASLGQYQKGGLRPGDEKREEVVRFIVPFYASSLISCSADGMLSTAQLRLAFSSLVAGASAGSDFSVSDGGTTDGAALVWYCIECLLSGITARHQQPTTQDKSSPEDQHERLVLMLVSLIAAIPPLPSFTQLLSRLLEAVEGIVKSEQDPQRQRMIKAIYEEILRSVGDQTREFVLKWWFDAFHPGEGRAEMESGPPTIRSRL